MPHRTPVQKPERSSSAVYGNVVHLPVPDSDAALVACLRNDPERGRDVLFERFARDVERILCRILGPDSELTDLLHDVFIAAMTSMDSLRDDRALRSWLTGIAVHQARRLIRRRKIRRLVRFMAPQDLPEGIAATPSQEVSDALRQTYLLLGRLPADDRIAFTLRQIEGMELATIAQLTRVSLATVKRRVTRAQRTFIQLALQNESLTEWLERGTLSS